MSDEHVLIEIVDSGPRRTGCSCGLDPWNDLATKLGHPDMDIVNRSMEAHLHRAEVFAQLPEDQRRIIL